MNAMKQLLALALARGGRAPFGGGHGMSSLEDLFSGGGSPLDEMFGGGAIIVSGNDPRSIRRTLDRLFPSETGGSSPEAVVFAQAHAYRERHAQVIRSVEQLKLEAAEIVANRRVAKLAKKAPQFVAAVQAKIDGFTDTGEAADAYRQNLERQKQPFEELKRHAKCEHVAGLLAAEIPEKLAAVNREIANLAGQFDSAMAAIDEQLGVGVSAVFRLPDPLAALTENEIWKAGRETTDNEWSGILSEKLGIETLPALPEPAKKPKLEGGRRGRRTRRLAAATAS